MATIAAFGEIMLRLSPPDGEVLFQSPQLRAVFGGAEANTAVSLARFGHDVRYVSAVPDNALGEAAVRDLRKWGVDTTFVLRRGRRLGLYFAEGGADQRASKVVYDREGSAVAEARRGDFAWDGILVDAGWFHVTGITPALSASCADLVLEAVRAARVRRASVSVDLNYRSALWRYGKKAPEVMREIVAEADLVVGNEEDCQKALGIDAPASGKGLETDFERLTARVMETFPNLARVAITLRRSHSADHNGWSAVLRTRGEFLTSPAYDIRDIVDRIGAGDAFSAGLIHGLLTMTEDGRALAFATAASCLKHSIRGDFNLVTEGDVMRLMEGEASGRIRR
jgi:2-dehydro-3-deoxygluconokinase